MALNYSARLFRRKGQIRVDKNNTKVLIKIGHDIYLNFYTYFDSMHYELVEHSDARVAGQLEFCSKRKTFFNEEKRIIQFKVIDSGWSV